jgi:gamma-glutamylaminecyclotransferase
MHKLFVYGSLKRGFKQHDRHMKTARFIAAVETAKPTYTLVAVLDSNVDAPYPGMMEGGAFHVKGELFEIDDAMLRRLDEYEGEGYARVTIALSNGDSAQTYIYNSSKIPVDAAHAFVHATENSREWIVQ